MENKGFNFALPFDPFRLLLTILERFGIILLAAVVCCALGVAYALVRLGPTYTTTVELVSEGWHSKRPDEGSAYVPMPITDEAVMIAAKAEPVFELAAKKISSDLPGSALRPMVGVFQLPGEGLFSVGAISGEGREETHELVMAYSEAIMEYTAILRQDEALTEHELLAKQLKLQQAGIEDISQEIGEFAENEGIDDPLGTNGSAGSQLGDLKKSLSIAEADLRSYNDETLAYLRKELMSKLNGNLSRALASHTEGHGSVRKLKATIRGFEDFMEKSQANGSVDLKEFKALDPPSEIFLHVQDLQSQRKRIEGRARTWREQLAESEAEAGGLPSQWLELAEMRTIHARRTTAAAVTSAKMGDAEFFAKNAPPALSVFHSPTVEEVRYKSLFSKAVKLGILGFIGGPLLVIGISLLVEFLTRKVRTPMQAAIAACAYPKLVYPPPRKTTNEVALRNFWIRGIASFLPTDRRIIFPVIGDVPKEAKFWKELFSALEGERQRVVFIDFSVSPMNLDLPQYNSNDTATVSQIDPSQYASKDLVGMAGNLPEGHVLLIRWGISPTSMLTDLAPHIDSHFVLTSQEVQLSLLEEEARNYRDVFGDPDGLLLINSQRPKRSQVIVNRLQDWYLDSYRRKDVRSMQAPLTQ